MVGFIVGVIIGGLLGIIVTCMAVISGRDE